MDLKISARLQDGVIIISIPVDQIIVEGKKYGVRVRVPEILQVQVQAQEEEKKQAAEILEQINDIAIGYEQDKAIAESPLESLEAARDYMAEMEEIVAEIDDEEDVMEQVVDHAENVMDSMHRDALAELEAMVYKYGMPSERGIGKMDMPDVFKNLGPSEPVRPSKMEMPDVFKNLGPSEPMKYEMPDVFKNLGPSEPIKLEMPDVFKNLGPSEPVQQMGEIHEVFQSIAESFADLPVHEFLQSLPAGPLKVPDVVKALETVAPIEPEAKKSDVPAVFKLVEPDKPVEPVKVMEPAKVKVPVATKTLESDYKGRGAREEKEVVETYMAMKFKNAYEIEQFLNRVVDRPTMKEAANGLRWGHYSGEQIKKVYNVQALEDIIRDGKSVLNDVYDKTDDPGTHRLVNSMINNAQKQIEWLQKGGYLGRGRRKGDKNILKAVETGLNKVEADFMALPDAENLKKIMDLAASNFINNYIAFEAYDNGYELIKDIFKNPEEESELYERLNYEISKAIKPVVSEKDINQYTVDKYILQIYLSNEIPKLNQYIISNEKIDEAKRKGGAKFEKAAEEAVKTLQKVARGFLSRKETAAKKPSDQKQEKRDKVVEAFENGLEDPTTLLVETVRDYLKIPAITYNDVKVKMVQRSKELGLKPKSEKMNLTSKLEKATQELLNDEFNKMLDLRIKKTADGTLKKYEDELLKIPYAESGEAAQLYNMKRLYKRVEDQPEKQLKILRKYIGDKYESEIMTQIGPKYKPLKPIITL